MRGGIRFVDENLRAAMRFFGEASASGEVQSAEPVQLIYSGLDYGVFNIALLTRPVTSERDLNEIIANCGRYYRQRNVRWSFWVCDDLLEPPARRNNREIFTEAGLRVISRAPGMVASALFPPSRPIPEIECRPVNDAASRSAFTGLTVSCFDIPIGVARAIYERESAWNGLYRGFVGFVKGTPVAIVALVRAGGALGVYSLGTVPEYRHKGYGEALLRAASASYRAASGDDSRDPSDSQTAEQEPMVLESTEAGYRLYRRIGFQDVTNFTVYLTR